MEISKISIVCLEGVNTYNIGDMGIVKFTEDVIQISESNRASFYVARDKDGNEIVLISKSAPLVVERLFNQTPNKG